MMAQPQAKRSTRRHSAAPNYSGDDAQSEPQTARSILDSISSLKNQMMETNNRLLNEKLDRIQADLDTLRTFVKKATPLIDC